MKIENFQLFMQSEYTHEESLTQSFALELQSESLERAKEELEAAEFEKEFRTQMQLSLLQLFLQKLHYPRIEPIKMIQEGEPIKVRSLHESTFTIKEVRSEYQSVCMTTQGYIQTENQCIAVNMNVNMSHTFVSEHQIQTHGFIDPLVINFDRELPELDDMSFSFDIDNDGECDQISCLKEGNGFLALDKNDNGVIDNGSELFGTELGNGFAELAQYDSDNNLWIDENDPILDKLRIWINEGDESRLVGLGEVGIGAIYLGQTATDFYYKNEEQTLGRLRSSGIFLYENGTTGTIAQVDFAQQEQSHLSNLLRDSSV